MKASYCIVLSVLLSCLFTPEAQAQFYYFTFGTDQLGPCSWDSSQNISQDTHWEAYQTQNDKWDGPKDSSKCIGIVASQIILADIDPNKPIFVRYLMPNPNFYVLWPNQLYANQYSAPSLTGNSTFLLADSICPNQQCTGIKLGIKIPDSISTGTATRWYNGNFTRDPFSFGTGFCFPSEKFPGQLIQEIFYRIQLDQYDSSSVLFLSGLDISEPPIYDTTSSFTLDNTTSSPSINLFNPFLMLHADSAYPGPNHPFYIDVKLQPPSNQQKTLFLNVEPLAYLTGQPFTELRGDTVTGGNGTRHQVVVVNQGGTFCVAFFEVVFRKGNGFRHEAGKLTFQDASGCMAFHPGSFLEVADGATLRYGENGLGVILLKEGVDVRLGKQSELRIANRLVLDALSEDGHVHIYLPPGRKLTFTQSAQILVGSKSANPEAKLVVHMRGGELDDSQLAPSSRNRIVKLVEKAFANYLESAQIRYGSTDSEPYVHLFCDELTSLDLRIIDLKGREVWHKHVTVNQGPSQITLPTGELTSALYFLRLGDGQKDRTLKFWIK